MAWMKKKKSWFNWVYLLCREMLSKIMAMKIKKIPSDVYDQMKFSISNGLGVTKSCLNLDAVYLSASVQVLFSNNQLFDF